MTRDDIIRMAREAGFIVDEDSQEHQPNCIFHTWHLIDEGLERFAALIEKHLLASGYRKCAEGQRTTQFCGQLEQAVAAEREMCAQVCDGFGEWRDTSGVDCAAAIRARGEKRE